MGALACPTALRYLGGFDLPAGTGRKAQNSVQVTAFHQISLEKIKRFG